jgi:hypothetical protein
VEQFISDPMSIGGNTNELGDMLSWTGVVSDSASWNSGLPLPAPYFFVYSSELCSFMEDGVYQHGMKWGSSKEIVPPSENQDVPKTKAEVLSWIQLSSSDDTNSRYSQVIQISIAAVILSTLVLSIVACLIALRITKPDIFAQALHPDFITIVSDKEEKKKGDIQLSRSY